MSGSIRSALGQKVRTARLARDWTQGELATRAGVSRGLVSAVERGAAEASLESIERIAVALDARLVVELRVPLVIGRDEQRDAAHARCVAAVRRALERRGFICVVEQPFADGRTRGWIDLLAFDPASGRLVVVEVKTQLRDFGGLLRQVGWYASRARAVAREIGWRVRSVDAVVVFLATEDNDAALEANADMIRSSFPCRGRALRAGLMPGGRLGGWGLAMIDPRRRGDRRWATLRLDGRRERAPYRSYADFIRVSRSGSPAASAASRATSPAAPEARRASRVVVTAPSERETSTEPPVRGTVPARTSA